MDDIWSFSFRTSEWTKIYTETDSLADMTRGGHMTVTHNGYLYMYGGLVFKKGGWSNVGSTSIMVKMSIKGDGRGQGRVFEEAGSSASIVDRGEASGGKWRNKMVFYGGLVVTPSAATAMNDANMYDCDTERFIPMSLANSAVTRPKGRFSHAAAVMGDKLAVFGGRAMEGKNWYLLSDVWSLDLNTEVWTKLETSEGIPRSYHSMVGQNDRFWTFGGYRTVSSIRGEITYVFSDLLTLSPSKSDNWMKFEPTNDSLNNVNVRFQQTTVMHEGVIVMFGGRFQTTEDVPQMYAINTTNISPGDMQVAVSDGLMAPTFGLAPLHLAIAVMLVMVLVFVTVFLVLRRRALMNEENGATGLFGRRSNGLDQAAIDAIPKVKYCKANPPPSIDSSEVCSICLCDYEDGEFVRILPCKHVFHPECVDTWLKRNSSCPACRLSIGGDSNSSTGSADSADGNEGAGGSGAQSTNDLALPSAPSSPSALPPEVEASSSSSLSDDAISIEMSTMYGSPSRSSSRPWRSSRSSRSSRAGMIRVSLTDSMDNGSHDDDGGSNEESENDIESNSAQGQDSGSRGHLRRPSGEQLRRPSVTDDLSLPSIT